MKYIKLKAIGFVIFPSSIEHADVARKFSEHGAPISAGQIIKIGQRLICMGDSMSLGGLEAGPTDTDDLQSQVARARS